MIWEEAMAGPEETDPPGKECTAAMSVDDKFSFGLWKRDVQRRHFERPTTRSPTSSRARSRSPTTTARSSWPARATSSSRPKGSKGYWKNLTPVKKVWGIYEEDAAGLNAYIGPGGF